jgi:hypothetical protein
MGLRWTTHLGWNALACAALLACGSAVHPGATPPGGPTATPPGGPGIPSSGPGSTLWEVALDYDTDEFGGPWADGDGNLFTIDMNAGKITAEKRDTSGALQWASEVKPACFSVVRPSGWFALGAADDGRFVVEVESCTLGAYRPSAERVTLLDPSGGVSREFTTGWGHALTVNRFGETFAVTADVGSPIVWSPGGGGWVSAWPMVLRLIGPDGTDAWVDRDGSLSLLPGSLQAMPDGGAVAIADNGTTAFRLDRDGTLLWTSELPVQVTPYVYPYTAALRDGTFVVAIETPGVVAYGAGQAGVTGERGRALLVVASDGSPRNVIPLPASAPGERWNVATTALATGGVAVWEYAASCARLWGFSCDLSLSWQRQLDASCTLAIGAAVSTPEGLVLSVAARFSSPKKLVALRQ